MRWEGVDQLGATSLLKMDSPIPRSRQLCMTHETLLTPC